MGHTTQRITELYAKHSPDFLSDAANALDTLFPVNDAEEGHRAPNARQSHEIEASAKRLKAKKDGWWS